METVKFDKGDTRVIAHRGLSGIERENTNGAFVAAGNRSYYGIETDIRRTADGRFVCVHDKDLKRVAGVNIDVEKSSLATLQEVVLYDADGGKDRRDLRLGTLENYVGICKKYGKHCVLELKSKFTHKEIDEIIRIINGFDYLSNTTFISFEYDNLLKIRKVLPQQSAQFLFSDFSKRIMKKLVADRIDVDVNYKELTKKIIDELHSFGLKVNCWTVDEKETAEKLSQWGVDYITSNILE